MLDIINLRSFYRGSFKTIHFDHYIILSSKSLLLDTDNDLTYYSLIFQDNLFSEVEFFVLGLV